MINTFHFLPSSMVFENEELPDFDAFPDLLTLHQDTRIDWSIQISCAPAVCKEVIESLSSRRFCHHGRQIAEEVWIDNGVFGAKF